MSGLEKRLFARSEPIDAGRASLVVWMLVLLIVCFCAWANWAHLDEQVRAPGKVVAASGSQVVQAVDGGVLLKLHVEQGSSVRRGDLLAELDQARFESRVNETRAEEMGLRATIIRLESELGGKALRFPGEILGIPSLVQVQTDLYHSRRQQLEQAQASKKNSLRLAEEELRVLRSLEKSGDAGSGEVLRIRRQVSELRGQLVDEVNAYRRSAQEQLAQARSQLSQVSEVLAQRRDSLRATEIRAPMSGKVRSIKVSTEGAVLASGDELLQIVPDEEPLLVEARSSSADVAFLRPGMRANVKLDAYDFAIYGSLRGEVTSISPDVIDTGLHQNEEPYYRVMVKITGRSLASADDIEIIPGMSGLVEIITGNRSVAQYLIKPLLRGSAAALRER